MNVKSQKKIASRILKAGSKRVWIDPERISEIKESITRADIKSLIGDLAIQKKQKKGISRVRARHKLKQKTKGRRKGTGSRKGKRTARLPRKKAWILKVRSQRNLMKTLRDKKYISKKTYSQLYRKIKSGFFRNRRHIKLYLTETKLFIEKNVKK